MPFVSTVSRSSAKSTHARTHETGNMESHFAKKWSTKVQNPRSTMTATSLEPALTKKLLLQKQPKQRITNEAVLLANELLRLFIVETRQRAAVEVS